MIVAIILVVVIFGSLVFVHELGHFVAARLNGVEVDEFGFGFPPRLVGKKVGKTIYSINWLPLGGFVRMRGEDQSDTSPGSFGGARILAKTRILLAGVGMNVLMAYVLLLWLCATGLPAALSGDFKLPAASFSSPKQVMVVQVSLGSPAAQAGLGKGDIVASANGQTLVSEDDLVDFTKAHAGQTVRLDVRHGGAERTLDVRLRGEEDGRTSGYLGVTPFQTYTIGFGWRSVWVAASLLGQMIWATLAGFVGAIAALVGHKTAGPAVAVTGPVGIVVLLSNILYLGARYILFFMATISVSLAVINVLPIPALDGGRLFLIWLGKIRRKPISPELEARIHTVGFAALLLLMVVITVLDVRRLHS